jgi:PLP dependent protein
MAVNEQAYRQLLETLDKGHVSLVAVSKTKPVEDINELYQFGHRDFGENYVQEMAEKQDRLPGDIRWHFIGHLQSNKVKLIAPFVHLIHGVDSIKLLNEINKQAAKHNRNIHCLLQVHIAKEETKFGLNAEELATTIDEFSKHKSEWEHITIRGLMGMASFTEDVNKIRSEFRLLKSLYDKYFHSASSIIRNPGESILSMGMSSDYQVAIEEGSTMVRIGSLLFGARNYTE